MEAEPYELVHSDAGRLVEVRVKCRTTGKPVLPRVPCCLGPMLLKNGTKTIQVRDRRIEAAPTWLYVQRQRFKCKTCGRTTPEMLPAVDDDHAITRRVREAIALSAVKRAVQRRCGLPRGGAGRHLLSRPIAPQARRDG